MSEVWAKNRRMLVAEIRGWGYLTGNGIGRLGLSADEAYEIQQANTRLLAAAPEMYNLLAYLLKRVRNEYQIDIFVNSKSMKEAEQLLSRIDGEQEEGNEDNKRYNEG